MGTRRRRWNHLTLFAIFSIAISLLIAAPTFSTNSLQTVSAAPEHQERLLHRLRIEGPEVEPLVITDIKVNGQSISFDKKFGADDDWMKSLVFSVKNRSDRLILFASLWLRFTTPEGSSQKRSIAHMHYGNDELVARKPTSQERLIGIAASETVDIHFTPEEAEDLPIFLSATGQSPNVEKAGLEIGEVLFEDDTMWNRGVLHKRDKEQLSTWTMVKR